MKKTIVIVILSALAIVASVRLKYNHDLISAKKNSAIAVTGSVSVNVAMVTKMAAERPIELVGTLNAWKELNISSETQGKIVSLNVEAGQIKAKGSIIAVIDDKLKKLAVQTMKVSVSKLEKDLERIDNLYKGGTASQQQLDDAHTLLENAKIQLDQANKQLADATIISPINGVITQKLTEQGAYINIGNPIATIVDISKLKVKMNVSETNVYLLRTGDKTTITTDMYPGASFEGHITFISAKGDDTHNYPVEIEMRNSATYPLKAGTFVTVHVDIHGDQTALCIPRQALQGSSKDASVYVVDNGKAVLKNIVVGNQNGEYLEIISGLAENEEVVTTGQVNISDGMPVLIAKK
jgi:RND family efflux transporter MFP subunit